MASSSCEHNEAVGAFLDLVPWALKDVVHLWLFSQPHGQLCPSLLPTATHLMHFKL